jgi:hypothetical protein
MAPNVVPFGRSTAPRQIRYRFVAGDAAEKTAKQ